MHKDIAVKIQNVSKVYKLYDEPIDRLKESLHPLKKKYHKDFYALKNINLEIKKGEVLGIVGVNGAGKSTLLKIITGVLTPTTGRVQINGKLNAILELGSGLKPDMTGRENIKLNLQINGIEKDRDKITEDIISFADIGEHIDQPIKTYSSGMKARLAFGIETSTDPDVLIVDEVLAVGDVLFQRKCYGRIEKLFKDGKTVIFVSHSAQSVIEFCSNAILLYDREIILEDTPKKVTDFYQKLVFSKDQKKVLDEIKGKKILKNKEKVKELEFSKINVVDEKFYLSNFTSQYKEIRNAKVFIKNIHLLNKYNKKVNILKNKENYKLKYEIYFEEDSRNVKFGHFIQSIKGLWISGETLPSRKKVINFIAKGTTYIVEGSFYCNLNQGTYLIDIAVTEDINSEKKYLIWRKDALIFKVEDNNQQFWALTNLWANSNLTNFN